MIFLFQKTKEEAEVVITEDKPEITGQFGNEINIEDITNIILVETMPSIG